MDWVGILVYMQTEYAIDESFDTKMFASLVFLALVLPSRNLMFNLYLLLLGRYDVGRNFY